MVDPHFSARAPLFLFPKRRNAGTTGINCLYVIYTPITYACQHLFITDQRFFAVSDSRFSAQSHKRGLRAGLGDAADADEDLGNFIPGGIVDDTRLPKVKDTLKGADGIGGGRAVDPVCCDLWNGGIVLGDPVKLLLDLQNLLPGCADAEIVARPGRGNAGDGYGRVDIHIASIVIADDLDRRVAFVAEILRSPLAQPAAGGRAAVAVGGENGLPDAGTREIVCKDGVHQTVDVGVDVPAADPFLVVGGGGGDREVVALVPIPLRIYPVQRKGHDRKRVGIDRAFRPGRVDLGGDDVFDIVTVFDIVVRGRGIRGDAVVDNDVLRDDHAAQNDFSCLIHRLDLILRYLGWIVAV